jgi:uncharacterized protein (DUF2141 family)
VKVMTKTMLVLGAAALTFVAQATEAEAALGPDASACQSGSNEPAVLVNVSGFKSKSGRVRVQVYNKSNFLVKGQRVRRIDLPVTSANMPICVSLPGPNAYAIAVRHDVNGNSKSGDWSDGGGFSRNPKLSLLKLKPAFSDVAVPVGKGVKPVNVVLNYRQGLSIGPVGRK